VGLAIVQARVSSSRLPGKVLKPILGQPMLARQLERVQRSRQLTQVVVATSTMTDDDPIVDLCHQLGIDCFRGSLMDVLDRFYQAAKPYEAETIVRLTGDCPLTDPGLIDQVITFHRDGNFDYTSNALEPTFPDGLDVEVIRFLALEQAWQDATLPSQREHVTPFIYQQPDRFHLGSYRGSVDQSHLRWTVDEPADFDLVTRIYNQLYPKNAAFTTSEILAFLDQDPALRTLNTHHQRNEGYQASLLKDQAFLNAQA